MLEVRGLEVSYGPVRAVDGVDLDVGDAEVVGLLGPNGAGKTSLLRAISGLVPHRGTVRYDGEDRHALGVEGAARRGLVHVPEGRRVFPTLTVEENLQLGTTARAGRPSAFSLDDVYDLFPALRSLRGRAGWALSGGEQQMVAIGRALVAAPRLLLLDEPSLGLAPKVSRAVFGALREVATRTAIVVVEQNTVLALALCDRASVLAGGKIVLSGPAAELRDREALIASYLGQRAAIS
jgi:branched-chain amino acid transport system ATP-binding protein